MTLHDALRRHDPGRTDPLVLDSPHSAKRILRTSITRRPGAGAVRPRTRQSRAVVATHPRTVHT